ncbi:MAG: hypothetical protein D3917_00905 [Candidatus Electrothrix sp. AX5]|jgi:hypothetical protein|nr:hypothetical protein [Candidatus Electrothrix sp. AX5]
MIPQNRKRAKREVDDKGMIKANEGALVKKRGWEGKCMNLYSAGAEKRFTKLLIVFYPMLGICSILSC